MKKKKRATIISILLVCLLAMAGSSALVISLVNAKAKEVSGEEKRAVSAETFSAWTDVGEFQTIPAMSGENIKISEADDYGEGNYLIGVDGATKEEYLAYLDTLTNAGFEKHSDNGEDAMEGHALTAAFQKDNLTVVVSYAIPWEKMYITAAYDLALSDHMIYKDEYVQGVSADAKTKVHMVELNDIGACFIIQLKNGHFVVHDGGSDVDTQYFIDYMKELVPGDEKPIIEAWFISHAHEDHYGVINEINSNPKYANMFYVNGVYYHTPSSDLFEHSYDANPKMDVYVTSRSHAMLKAEDGSKTKFYRPQLGQRYYFCDTYIDVAMTPEQYAPESFYLTTTKIDMNDCSIWLMHHIEDQRMLVGGDSFHTGIRAMMNMYEESYFNMEIFVILHHGVNVYNYFTDYMTLKTVLFPNFRVGSVWEPSKADLARVEDNEYLKKAAAECISCENGTVVITFPYNMGEAEILGPREWIYNGGRDYTPHEG